MAYLFDIFYIILYIDIRAYVFYRPFPQVVILFLFLKDTFLKKGSSPGKFLRGRERDENYVIQWFLLGSSNHLHSLFTIYPFFHHQMHKQSP